MSMLAQTLVLSDTQSLRLRGQSSGEEDRSCARVVSDTPRLGFSEGNVLLTPVVSGPSIRVD
jgi:hypothetical protein